MASLNIAAPSNNFSISERADADVIKRSADLPDMDSEVTFLV